jgi:hypothetical protein
MTEKLPISEVIEDFARQIIEEAEGEALPVKLDAFTRITAYFVGIHKVGANKKEDGGGMAAAKKAIEGM